MSAVNEEQCAVKGIQRPGINDVLCARGNFAMVHPGNKFFRHLVAKFRTAYVLGDKNDKDLYSTLIVDTIRGLSPSGIFLKEDPQTNLYHDVGYTKALSKTRQALREGAPQLLKKLSNDSGNAQAPEGSFQKTSTELLLRNHSLSFSIPKEASKQSEERARKMIRTSTRSKHETSPITTNLILEESVNLGDTITDTLNHANNNVHEKCFSRERKGKCHDSHKHEQEHILVHGEIRSMRTETNRININHDMLQASQLRAALGTFEATRHNEGKPLLEEKPSLITSFEKTTFGQKRKFAVIETADTSVPDKTRIFACPIAYISNSDDISVTLTKVKQIKQVALMKAKENNWKESHDILQHIYEIERKMYFCRKKRCSLLDLSDTLYYLGIACAQLGKADLALEALHESLSFRPQKLVTDGIGALTIQYIGMIRGSKTIKEWQYTK